MLANPVVEQVVTRLLGGGVFMRYYNGNTACPGTGHQPLHMDGGGWSVKSEAEARAAGLAWPHEPGLLTQGGSRGRPCGLLGLAIRDSIAFPRTA